MKRFSISVFFAAFSAATSFHSVASPSENDVSIEVALKSLDSAGDVLMIADTNHQSTRLVELMTSMTELYSTKARACFFLELDKRMQVPLDQFARGQTFERSFMSALATLFQELGRPLEDLKVFQSYERILEFARDRTEQTSAFAYDIDFSDDIGQELGRLIEKIRSGNITDEELQRFEELLSLRHQEMVENIHNVLIDRGQECKKTIVWTGEGHMSLDQHTFPTFQEQLSGWGYRTSEVRAISRECKTPEHPFYNQEECRKIATHWDGLWFATPSSEKSFTFDFIGR